MVRIQSSANFYIEHLFTVNCVEKTKKRPRTVHLKKPVFKRRWCRNGRSKLVPIFDETSWVEVSMCYRVVVIWQLVIEPDNRTELNWTDIFWRGKFCFFLSKFSEKGSKIWIKVNFSICGESLRAVTFSLKFIVFGFMWFLLQHGAGRRHSSPQSLSKNVILQKMWFWNCQMLFLKALVCTLKCWKVFSENIFKGVLPSIAPYKQSTTV